jgi:hypothetical protein
MSNLSKNQHDKLANLSKHLLLRKTDEARKAEPGAANELKSATPSRFIHFAKPNNLYSLMAALQRLKSHTRSTLKARPTPPEPPDDA